MSSSSAYEFSKLLDVEYHDFLLAVSVMQKKQEFDIDETLDDLKDKLAHAYSRNDREMIDLIRKKMLKLRHHKRKYNS